MPCVAEPPRAALHQRGRPEGVADYSHWTDSGHWSQNVGSCPPAAAFGVSAYMGAAENVTAGVRVAAPAYAAAGVARVGVDGMVLDIRLDGVSGSVALNEGDSV